MQPQRCRKAALAGQGVIDVKQNILRSRMCGHKIFVNKRSKILLHLMVYATKYVYIFVQFE
jgi:hypothetical protein